MSTIKKKNIVHDYHRFGCFDKPVGYNYVVYLLSVEAALQVLKQD